MATFKDLVEGTLFDSDTGGRRTIPNGISPADTTGQQALAVRFVREAWRRIQQDDEQWLWMRKSFSADLVEDQSVYSWSDLGIPRKPRSWLTPLIGGSIWYITGENGTGQLQQLTWEQYRARTVGQTQTPSRPTAFIVQPDQRLAFYPVPDDSHTVSGEYQSGVHVFGNTIDAWGEEPELIPEEFHDMIKWAAIMMVHSFDEASESYAFAQNEYAKDHNNMKRSYLPGYTVVSAIGSGSVQTGGFGGDSFSTL